MYKPFPSDIFEITTFEIKKGVILAKYIAKPKDKPEKEIDYVGILHGIDDYVEVYSAIAQFLVENGFGVFGYDRRGRGYSVDPKEKAKGKVSTYITHLKTDLDDFVAVKNLITQQPVHLLGNSLGGLIALDFAIQRPDLFKSVITYNPSI